MMYGTAWKKGRTADLVYEAIKAGFRGIDTAAMKKHYDEELTGEGIRRAIREGIVSRKDLFVNPPSLLTLPSLTHSLTHPLQIQTKFTPLDPSSPYSLSSPIPTQIHSSVASSLANLSPPPSHQANSPQPYLDALVLHSPFPTPQETLLALQTLQLYLPTSSDPTHAGKILRLGISNVPLSHLRSLPEDSSISIIQNRFYSTSPPIPWDKDVRVWCADHGATYQGFWTLTGNVEIWQRAGFVRDLASGAGISLAAAWYVLLRAAAGVTVLNGTGDREHMREDLEAWDKVEDWKGTLAGGMAWPGCLDEFKGLIEGG